MSEYEETIMSFGKNVGYYRKKMKMTQDELAERLYVSRQTISRWETDAILPDVETVIRLCELFECNMDTLVRGDAEIQSETSDSSPAKENTQPPTPPKNPADRWLLGERINEAVSSTVMLIALIVFLLCGILWGLWHPAWIAFVVGALLCGISGIIIHAIFHR